MPARPAARRGVLSANVHRRHMTKGQRAMAVAMIYPEPERFSVAGRRHPVAGVFVGTFESEDPSIIRRQFVTEHKVNSHINCKKAPNTTIPIAVPKQRNDFL